jgi:predicted permease
MYGITALKVLMMIAYGVPGYLLIKTKLLSEEAIKVFAKFLLYVCQPALSLYTLTSIDSTPLLIRDLWIFFFVTLVAQVAVILLYSLFFRKRMKTDLAHRVCAIAGICGNVGFFGIPLLEYLIPGVPEVRVYSAAFSISMNVIGWTLGLLLLTGNRKYIKAKAVFLNPSVITFAVSFALFAFGVRFPELPAEYIETLGRMSTVVCMTVLGMRLATKSIVRIFTNYHIYIAAALKLIVTPIIIYALFAFLPVGQEVKTSAFILACCPAATVIQSLAETHGGDSKTAADIVLSTSLICIVTIPLMWTLYNTFVI